MARSAPRPAVQPRRAPAAPLPQSLGPIVVRSRRGYFAAATAFVMMPVAAVLLLHVATRDGPESGLVALLGFLFLAAMTLLFLVLARRIEVEVHADRIVVRRGGRSESIALADLDPLVPHHMGPKGLVRFVKLRSWRPSILALEIPAIAFSQRDRIALDRLLRARVPGLHGWLFAGYYSHPAERALGRR